MEPPITVAINTALGSAPMDCAMDKLIGTIKAVVAVFDIKFVKITHITNIITNKIVGEGFSPRVETIVLATS